MNVSDLIKALADFSPSSEVRVISSMVSCGDKIVGVRGVDGRAINQGKVVFIQREAPE